MRVARLTLPSTNRTCRFPASGSARELSPQTLASSCAVQLQRQQTQSLEMLVVANPFRRSEGPLAAASHMPRETLTDVRVDFPIRLPRLAKREVVSPALQVSIQFANQARQRYKAPLAANLLPQLSPFPQ